MYARFPLGALALARVMEGVCTAFVHRHQTPRLHRPDPLAEGGPFPLVALLPGLPGTFFERPPSRPVGARWGPPERGRRRERHTAMGLLERLAVLFKREVWSFSRRCDASHPSSATPFTQGRSEIGFASTLAVSRRRLSQRLLVGTETEKILASSSLGTRRSIAASTLMVRSLE